VGREGDAHVAAAGDRAELLLDLGGVAVGAGDLVRAQALADLDLAHEMVRQAVANCPEDRLDQRHYEELGPNGAGLETDHAKMITDWREKEDI